MHLCRSMYTWYLYDSWPFMTNKIKFHRTMRIVISTIASYYGWVFSMLQPCPNDNRRKPFAVGDDSMINQIQQIGVTKHGYTRQMVIIIVKIIIFRSIYGYPIDKPKYQLVWPFNPLSHFAWSSTMISNKSWCTLNGRIWQARASHRNMAHHRTVWTPTQFLHTQRVVDHHVDDYCLYQLLNNLMF